MTAHSADLIVDPDDPVVVHRACGAVLGAAVADALGAPFEFGDPADYHRRFPSPVLGGIGELVGGGGFGWAPGQFTDDTEMAVATAESLLACDGLDLDDQLARFRAWAGAAADVGILTREVLGSGLPAGAAAGTVFDRRGGRSTAGNGSLMRALHQLHAWYVRSTIPKSWFSIRRVAFAPYEKYGSLLAHVGESGDHLGLQRIGAVTGGRSGRAR